MYRPGPDQSRRSVDTLASVRGVIYASQQYRRSDKLKRRIFDGENAIFAKPYKLNLGGIIPPMVSEALGRIGELYGIEEQIRWQNPGVRERVRKAHASPQLNELHRWLIDTVKQLS